MLEANVKIIQQLKYFLTRISCDKILLQQFSQSTNDFTRTRKLPFEKLVLLITKLCKKTLSVEIEKYFDEPNIAMPCSVSAFSQQRTKLDPSFFYYWNMVLWMNYDRNFCNYKMVALHQFQEREIKFIIRAKESQNIIRKFIESKASSTEIFLEPTCAAIKGLRKGGYVVDKNTLLRVRLVRIQLEGKIEVLMTNLWEKDGHAASEFKKLYFMRWGIEINISFRKNIMQLESFSGLTPVSVLPDFYATIFIANLHSLLVKEAQQTINKTMQHRKYPMKINNNRSFGKMKSIIVPLFLNFDPEIILLQLHDYFIRAPLPIRKGRTFERIRKNRQSNSKFRTFTNFKPAY